MARKQRTQRVLRYIAEFKERHDGVSPSTRDIAKDLSLSLESVSTALEVLEATGAITRHAHARGIGVTGGKWTPPAKLKV